MSFESFTSLCGEGIGTVEVCDLYYRGKWGHPTHEICAATAFGQRVACISVGGTHSEETFCFNSRFHFVCQDTTAHNVLYLCQI
jgi:hypothetical protein